jgi:capsular exopolysaccharide synthesis family protein
MELGRYIRLLLRWFWLIPLIALIAGAAAYVVNLRAIPIYESSTTLLINQTSSDSTTIDFNSLRTSEGLARTYVTLLYKRPILEQVIANLKLDIDPKRLEQKVSVSTVRDTQLIVLTVEDPNPQLAAKIANEIVHVFGQYMRDLQASRYATTQENLQQELLKDQADIDNTQAKIDVINPSGGAELIGTRNQLRVLLDQQRASYAMLLKNYEQVRVSAARTIDNLSVVEPAEPEMVPVRPKRLLNAFLAVLVGAMAGFGMVFLLGYLDSSVKSSADVENLIGAVTLASIARVRGPTGLGLVTIKDARSAIAETYRMLRVNIDFSAIDRPIQTLVVTSSVSAEGKSTTSANLAVILARSGRRVILVDADLRKPTLHTFFDQTNERGLTMALIPEAGALSNTYLVDTGIENLLLMPSGPLPPNPAELLSSQRMTKLLEDLKGQADIVLIDSPPVLAVVDPMLVARMCDAVLLVALAGSTRSDQLKRTAEQIMQSGTKFLGVVLNGVPRSETLSDLSYYFEGHRSPSRGVLRGWRNRLRRRPSRDADGELAALSASGVNLPVNGLAESAGSFAGAPLEEAASPTPTGETLAAVESTAAPSEEAAAPAPANNIALELGMSKIPVGPEASHELLELVVSQCPPVVTNGAGRRARRNRGGH